MEPPADEFDYLDWSFSATKRRILNSAECSAAESRLNIPLPEICFGNNRLLITQKKKSDGQDDQVVFKFDALDALAEVDSTGVEQGTGNLKVAHAKLWEKHKSQAEQANFGGERLTVVKNYDWTYSSTYAGSVQGASSPKGFEPAPAGHPGIPLARLADTSEPILFFNQVTLYEDELHDNGLCDVVVRVRVMSHGWFVLQRFFLRVDNVLFRMHDTRMYHAFGSNEVIRETKGRQAAYSRIKDMLPSDQKDDLTPLTDSNWVGQKLGMLSPEAQHPEDRIIQGQEEASPTPWKGLTQKLELLRL